MPSWKEERDRLVAQTLEFVQQVAAANPGRSQQQLDVESPAQRAPSLFGTAVPAIEMIAPPAESATPVGTTSDICLQDERPPGPQLLTAAMLANHARPALYSGASERADILQRVAAFKARQNQINREREAYCDAVQARIRTSLGNDSSRDRL